MKKVTGTDEWGGTAPSQERKDLLSPPEWRLESIASTSRPYALTVSPDRSFVSFLLDRSDLGCDVWIMHLGEATPVQLTTDRGPHPFWEDTTPRISPDGTMVAYGLDGWIAVVPVSGGPARRLVEGGSPAWLPDGRLIATIEHDRRRSPPPPAPVRYSRGLTRLCVVDPADPWAAVLTPPGIGDINAAIPSPDGRSIALVVSQPEDRNRSDVVVLTLDAGTTVRVAGVAGMHAAGPAWSPDGSWLAYVSEEPGWYAVHTVRPDGTDRRQVTEPPGDFSDLRWSPDGEQILASRALRGHTDLVAIEPGAGAVEVIASGGSWTDADWLDGDAIVCLFEDAATPTRIERVDRDGGRRTLFNPAPASVRAAHHVTPDDIVFSSFDGLEIHGFLFRPAAAEHGRVPAVVYPHGGPTSAYGDEWDGHAQYFVDKGYAWFAINFRGSTSYGRDFERANHGVWGVADTQDCLAAHELLAGLEWIDPSRIAIFGASYGSYLALCSLTDGDRFACGVAKYGDCDILTSWAQGDRAGAEDLERMMGHPSAQRAAYRAGSPIHRVEAIDQPILVAHGEMDDRVHPEQSKELVAALARLGKTYEYVTYPTEGHGLLRTEPQLHFYRRLERFLDWYLM